MFYFGTLISGVSFFDVQEARMSRVHGCTRATLATSFFGQAKKKYLAAKGETNTKKSNSSYFILDSRFHEYDGCLLDTSSRPV